MKQVAIHDLTPAFRNPKSIKRPLTFLLHLQEQAKYQFATDFVNL